MNNRADEQTVVIFYVEKNGAKHFTGWEPIALQPLEIDVFETKEDFIEYIEDLNNHEKIPNTYNIIEDCEGYDLTSLKELLFIIACLEYPEDDTTALITYTNLWYTNNSPSSLAVKIGKSEEYIKQMLLGEIEVTDDVKQDIANALNFDIREYEWSKTELVFDETDI